MKKRIEKLNIPDTKFFMGLRDNKGNFIELKEVGEKVNEIIDYLNTRDSITVDGTLYRSMKRELDSYKWKESEGTVVELMVCTKHGKTICEECIQGGEWEKRVIYVKPENEEPREYIDLHNPVTGATYKVRKKSEDAGKEKRILEDTSEERLKDAKLVASWVYDGDKWKEQDTTEWTDPTGDCDCDFCRGYRWSHEKEEDTPEEMGEQGVAGSISVSRTEGTGSTPVALAKDTPEEWEEDIRGLLWRMKYSNIKDYYEKGYVEELISKVKQLLEERTFTRSELSNLKDWIDNEYVPSMEARDVIDERIIKKVNRLLSKLNSEEK